MPSSFHAEYSCDTKTACWNGCRETVHSRSGRRCLTSDARRKYLEGAAPSAPVGLSDVSPLQQAPTERRPPSDQHVLPLLVPPLGDGEEVAISVAPILHAVDRAAHQVQSQAADRPVVELAAGLGSLPRRWGRMGCRYPRSWPARHRRSRRAAARGSARRARAASKPCSTTLVISSSSARRNGVVTSSGNACRCAEIGDGAMHRVEIGQTRRAGGTRRS